jgi:hypothetical protein
VFGLPGQSMMAGGFFFPFGHVRGAVVHARPVVVTTVNPRQRKRS